MPGESRARETTIFTIRLWRETLSSGETEWRGAVKHLVSGEVRYFKEWSALVQLLPRMLEDTLWSADFGSDFVPHTGIEEEGGESTTSDAPG